MRSILLTITILLLCSLPISPAQSDYRIFTRQILDVEQHWNNFIRAYFGCPPLGEINSDTCKRAKEHIDATEFRSHCEAVRALHKLSGSCSMEDSH